MRAERAGKWRTARHRMTIAEVRERYAEHEQIPGSLEVREMTGATPGAFLQAAREKRSTR
jgi:hypothetical protein